MLPFLAVLPCAISAVSECQRRVCYYTSWSQYRHGPAKFQPNNIDPDLCTHLIYSFANLTHDHLGPYEWNDESTPWSRGMYEKFTKLKDRNPNLKTMIAVGGWKMGSKGFSHMVANETTRKFFIEESIKFLRDHNFDGLDIDWEYPAFRGSPESDKENFQLLLDGLREAFDENAVLSGKPKLLLSVAVAAGKDKIDKAYDIANMSAKVDFINLMTYDYHGNWENQANHHSPLYGLPSDTGLLKYYNINFTVNYFISQGAPPEKLNLGLATYGITYVLADDTLTDVMSPISGPGPKGRFTGGKGLLAYYEICEKIDNGAVVENITRQQVPYAVDGSEWIGFDNEESLRNKVNFALDHDLGGVMFWSLDLDDFRGAFCNSGKFPLFNAVKDECTKRSINLQTPVPIATKFPVIDISVILDTTASPKPVTTISSTSSTTSTSTKLSTDSLISNSNKTSVAVNIQTATSTTSKQTTKPTTSPPHTTDLPTTSSPISTTHQPTTIGTTATTQTKSTSHPTTSTTMSTATPTTMTTTTPTTMTTSPSTTTSTTTMSTTTAVNLNSLCKDLHLWDGIHPDPTSCLHFIECDHGNTVRLKCPPGTGYQSNTMICDYISNISGCY